MPDHNLSQERDRYNSVRTAHLADDGVPHAVLVVDDESTVRLVMTRILKEHGYRVIEAPDGNAGIAVFERERPSAVLLDLRMPGMNGMQALQEMRRVDDTVPVIIITAHGDIPSAVEATRLGAYDFIPKSPEFDKLLVLLKHAIETKHLKSMVRRLNAEVLSTVESVMGKSGAIRAVAEQIHQVANSNFSVLIQGDTGTGKSFIARMIHDLSHRAKGPFVMVDVGAIPDTLMESELYGFERGAFTGAEHGRSGYFERAHSGTLFIDELQNMSPIMQGKLLAAVEERRIHRLGGIQPLAVDIRIVCATNADIMAMVHGGRIRQDLYFRLGEIVIALPPLRDRVEDIRFLAQRFLEEAAADLKKPVGVLSDDAASRLQSHHWPGNIRELKNVIRRAALTATGTVIGPEHLQFHAARSDRPSIGEVGAVSHSSVPDPTFKLEDVEKQTVIKAIAASGGNKTKAAALLSVDYKTLLRKIKRYGI